MDVPVGVDAATGVVRAAIYRRISLDASGMGMGVERQLDLGVKLAEARQWRVTVAVEQTCDNSLSAFAEGVQRPGFELLLRLIEAGEVDAIVAQAMDRLCANQRDGVRLLERCKKRGVRLAFLNGGDLDLSSPMGEFVANMMILIAQLERGTKGARQKVANRQRAELGIPWKAAGRAFGWLDHDTRHGAEAPALVQAYRRVLAGGTLRGIATDWNSRGLLGKQGKRWTQAKVKVVLLNPRNCGRMLQAGVDYGQRFDPIIDPETFEAVRAILTDPLRYKGAGPRRLLSGIARCPCGQVVSGAPNSRGVRAYRHQPDGGDEDGRGHVCRAADPVDGYITGLVLLRLARPDAVALLRPPDDTPSVDLAALRQRKAVLLAKAEQAARTWVGSDGGSELAQRQLRVATAAIESELRGIDQALKTACATSALAPLVDTVDPATVWDGLDLDARRAVIKELFASIVIGSPGRGRPRRDKTTGWPLDLPETIHVRWRHQPADPIDPDEVFGTGTPRPVTEAA